MPGERRIKENRVGFSWILLSAFLVVFSDQVTKLLVRNVLSSGDSIPLIENIFHITLVFNTGAAFGILKAQNVFFVLISIACILFILAYLPRLKSENTFTKIGFALLLGGIFGNLIDRLRFGHVVDFLDFRIWPVFNIADSAITIGAAFIIIQLLRRKT